MTTTRRENQVARVKGSAFPLVSNMFGTTHRARFLVRDTLDAVRRLVELKLEPSVRSVSWERIQN